MLTENEWKDLLDKAATSYVDGHRDSEVRRMFGHYYRAFCDGAIWENERSQSASKPADQSREEYFEQLEELYNHFAETPFDIEEDITKEKILAMTFDRIKELEAKQKAISTAYSQYVFFMDGYRNGSASISEVNAAQSEFLILLNEWLPKDARNYTDGELSDQYYQFKQEREEEEKNQELSQ